MLGAAGDGAAGRRGAVNVRASLPKRAQARKCMHACMHADGQAGRYAGEQCPPARARIGCGGLKFKLSEWGNDSWRWPGDALRAQEGTRGRVELEDA
eukprot:247397-Chlamydomonas_euryale.AAC.6